MEHRKQAEMIRRACLALTVLMAMAAVVADAVPAGPPYRVFFLGGESPEARRAFEMFIAAVTRSQPALARTVAFTVWDMDTHGPDPDAAIKSAMAKHPDMLVALNGFYAAASARNAGKTPVVFSSYEDPIRYGIVSDMKSRPEPICGISLADTLEGKRFEILRQAFPRTRDVAVLADRSWADDLGGRARVDEEGRRLGLHVSVLLAEDRPQVAAVLSAPEATAFDAWYIPATHLADDADALVLERLHAWRKPGIWASTVEVDHGAQMAYAQDTGFVWASVAELVSRVRMGERAGSIPILRPTRFTLAVRMVPGDDMPAPDIGVLRRADVVRR